jgi:hypothetical protein
MQKSTYKKSAAFLYATHKQADKEIKKTIPFTIASKIPTNKFN